MVRRKKLILKGAFLHRQSSIQMTFSNIAHKRRNVCFKGLRRVHTPPHLLTAHTAAYTAKHRASLMLSCGVFNSPLAFGQRKAEESGCTPYGVCPLPSAQQLRWATQFPILLRSNR